MLTHVFSTWSAGSVTTLHSLLQRALRVESLLSLDPWLCDVALGASCCCPHGTPRVTCLLRRLVTVHVHVAILRRSALAEGLRVDATVCSCNLLSCLKSRSPRSQGAHPARRLQSSLLWLVAGGQSGTLDSITHFLIDRSAFLVEPSSLFRVPCCPAASSSGAMVAARDVREVWTS